MKTSENPLVNDAAPAVYEHRVGTLTLGLTLLCFGILYLLRIFIPQLDYRMVFEFWPVVLILLGIEILLSTIRMTRVRIRYDGAAIFLIILTLAGTAAMACLDWFMNNLPALQQYWR